MKLIRAIWKRLWRAKSSLWIRLTLSRIYEKPFRFDSINRHFQAATIQGLAINSAIKPNILALLFTLTFARCHRIVYLFAYKIISIYARPGNREQETKKDKCIAGASEIKPE